VLIIYVRGGLSRNRRFYVENGVDKKMVDEIVNKSELPGYPKSADGRALAAADYAHAGNFLPVPDKRHDFQGTSSLHRGEGRGLGEIGSQRSRADAAYVRLDDEILVRAPNLATLCDVAVERWHELRRQMDPVEADIRSMSSQSTVCDALAETLPLQSSPSHGPTANPDDVTLSGTQNASPPKAPACHAQSSSRKVKVDRDWSSTSSDGGSTPPHRRGGRENDGEGQWIGKGKGGGKVKTGKRIGGEGKGTGWGGLCSSKNSVNCVLRSSSATKSIL